MISAGAAAKLDPAVAKEIEVRLSAIVSDEAVRIPLAIESGSRAWGFPSPDSDYDCRFIYIRRLEDYLSLSPARDVIETPLTPVFDINGWDLRKALILLLKGNAVVIEWLTSPLTYRADDIFRSELLALAEAISDHSSVLRHYHHLALSSYRRFAGDGAQVPLKKLFYVLRPLIARLWLERHGGQRLAPMHFPTLCAEVDLEASLHAEISELIARKAMTRELGAGAVPGAIERFIASEIARAPLELGSARNSNREARALADAFFREWLERA